MKPGHKEARATLYKAIANRDQMRLELDNIDALDIPESTKIARRGDWQRGLDQAEIDLAAAQAAVDVFKVKPLAPHRDYFDVQFNVAVSLTNKMHGQACARMETEGIRFPELIRRALAVYLKNETIGTKEN